MDINCITLQGRLTKDADLKYSQNNTAMLFFSIAVNRMKKPGEDDSKADFINCRIFGEKCEKIQRFLTKGRQVFLQGRLQIDNYEENGQFKSYTQVIVSQINFVWTDADKKEGGESKSYAVQHGRPQETAHAQDFEDDIPF
ncbi:MAG: single-stranded DNA-binding protein [Lachnospiraceae bacterium]|nr:single-stranded DNA-binding protein [Lachnospiraceae bacterium]